MTKMVVFGALALSLLGGAALAAGETGTSALDDPAKMQPFYTDSTMKSLRSEDEFIKAWKALTDEDRTAMTKSCDEEAANAHPEFCSSVKKNGAGSANN
ncbi:hypothetical protein LHFGNBLO_005866 [Mesorhizobium sp. AR10]|uniref:hypothetical protein n=1 Tax=Mesorhizobium sp. AR10 TaxID=2865839 RepID=UPI002161004F|nr:hypothetical protein [Mesorhizobium sp. AR10]UVK38662.1 hypothetical protein LHFGNBLO_005866 [Mesorhizobium sp. AR10]